MTGKWTYRSHLMTSILNRLKNFWIPFRKTTRRSKLRALVFWNANSCNFQDLSVNSYWHATVNISRYTAFYSCRKTEAPEDVILKNIKQCADVVNSNVIEHTAFIRASAAQNNLPLDKFREEVHKQLFPSSGDTSKYIASYKLLVIYPSGISMQWTSIILFPSAECRDHKIIK